MQCGLKSQLAYICIYIYMCATSVTLRNAIKSPVTFLICVITMSVRSVYVLLLCPRGASTCSRWRPDELHGCHLCTFDARRIRDLDKSITYFYPGRLTTAPTQLEFV